MSVTFKSCEGLSRELANEVTNEINEWRVATNTRINIINYLPKGVGYLEFETG